MLSRIEYKYIVAILGVFAIFMELLDSTVVNVAIPTFGRDFEVTSPTTIQWVITGYLLSLAVFIPVSGWAGDRFGTTVMATESGAVAEGVLRGSIGGKEMDTPFCLVATIKGGLITEGREYIDQGHLPR